jgi:medium-chain acyl-[acyl-carrier-protein] hydrolase
MDERPLTQMQDVVDLFVRAAAPLLDRPVVLLGHSMGAAVAFAVAHRLGSSVAHVFVAGRSAPLGRHPGALHTLDDEALERYLARLGATPPIIFEDPDLRADVLAIVRADLTLNDDYWTDRPLGATPLTVLGGRDDPDVSPDALEAWRFLTGGRFRRVILPGDHFFITSSREAVHRLIVEAIDPTLS